MCVWNFSGVVVVNSEGITVKSTLDNTLSAQVTLIVKFQAIRKIIKPTYNHIMRQQRWLSDMRSVA
jgi:hypothetical protein